MRKILMSLAAAGTAFAFAAPASAQYPGSQPYGYGAPYGNAYGYNNYGQVRSLQVRVNALQRQIDQLRNRRMITRNEANGLRNDARDLERRLYAASRNGLNYNEVRNIEYRIARLEQRIGHEVRDGNRWNNNGNSWNNSNGYYDRDRDGRDDRYEDDRGTRHD